MPAHGAVMHRVSVPRNPAQAPATAQNTTLAVTSDAAQVAPGSSIDARVTLTDNGRLPIAAARLPLTAPSGWTLRRTDGALSGRVVASGRSITATYRLTAPRTAPPISAAGTGVAAATTRAAATDQYGAVCTHGVTDGSTVRTTVTARSGTARGANAGLMIRNDATAAGGSPEGVALYVTGTGAAATRDAALFPTSASSSPTEADFTGLDLSWGQYR